MCGRPPRLQDRRHIISSGKATIRCWREDYGVSFAACVVTRTELLSYWSSGENLRSPYRIVNKFKDDEKRIRIFRYVVATRIEHQFARAITCHFPDFPVNEHDPSSRRSLFRHNPDIVGGSTKPRAGVGRRTGGRWRCKDPGG